MRALIGMIDWIGDRDLSSALPHTFYTTRLYSSYLQRQSSTPINGATLLPPSNSDIRPRISCPLHSMKVVQTKIMEWTDDNTIWQYYNLQLWYYSRHIPTLPYDMTSWKTPKIYTLHQHTNHINQLVLYLWFVNCAFTTLEQTFNGRHPNFCSEQRMLDCKAEIFSASSHSTKKTQSCISSRTFNSLSYFWHINIAYSDL